MKTSPGGLKSLHYRKLLLISNQTCLPKCSLYQLFYLFGVLTVACCHTLFYAKDPGGFEADVTHNALL